MTKVFVFTYHPLAITFLIFQLSAGHPHVSAKAESHQVKHDNLVTLVLVTPSAIVRPVVGERAVGLTWNRTYSTDWYSVARSVAQTKDGGFIITGQGLGHGLWVMKANAAGGPGWQRTYTLAPPFYDEYGDWVTL